MLEQEIKSTEQWIKLNAGLIFQKQKNVLLFWLAAISLQERNIKQANRWWPELITPIHLVRVNNKHDLWNKLWKANAHSAFIFTRRLKRARKNKPSDTWKIHLPDTPEINKGKYAAQISCCVCVRFPEFERKSWTQIISLYETSHGKCTFVRIFSAAKDWLACRYTSYEEM